MESGSIVLAIVLIYEDDINNTPELRHEERQDEKKTDENILITYISIFQEQTIDKSRKRHHRQGNTASFKYAVIYGPCVVTS